mgnify:CR=1 FL=1
MKDSSLPSLSEALRPMVMVALVMGLPAQQYSLSEGVEGADGGPVELVDGGGAAFDGGVVAGGASRLGGLLEHLTDAVSKFGGSLLGEGDGGNGAEFGAAGGDQLEHPVDERGRLAGAGPGFDEQRGIECPVDDVSLVLVWRGDAAHDGEASSGGVIRAR